jgi:hypothetical protein
MTFLLIFATFGRERKKRGKQGFYKKLCFEKSGRSKLASNIYSVRLYGLDLMGAKFHCPPDVPKVLEECADRSNEEQSISGGYVFFPGFRLLTLRSYAVLP